MDDYRPWEVQVRPPKEKVTFVSPKDDRDFKSVNHSDYIEMKVPLNRVKVILFYYCYYYSYYYYYYCYYHFNFYFESLILL